MTRPPNRAKKDVEAAARLEEQADAILARDAALLRELGVHADALRRCYEELMQPRMIRSICAPSRNTRRTAPASPT
jgi:hypothetical protein